MKFTVDRKSFLETLLIGGAASSRKNNIPILEFAKFKVDERQVVVCSSDNELYITKRTFVECCDGEKEFCASSNDLIRALKSIKEETVTVEVDEKIIKIRHTFGVMKLPYVPSSDFPVLLKAEETATAIADCEEVFNMIESCKGFIDDKRETAISGMYIYVNGKEGGVCGTDGQKLFSDKFSLEKECAPCNAIIPMSAVPHILNTINGGDKVYIVFEGKNMTFKVHNARINCRVLDMHYPPYEKIIPTDNNNVLSVDKETLKSSVNRVKMFSNNAGGALLNVDISADNMDMVAKDYKEGKEGSESVSVSHTDEDISIGLNGNILYQCLSVIDSDEVTIKIKDYRHGILFLDGNNPDRIIMQMPIVRQ